MLKAESAHDLDTGVCEITVSGPLDLQAAGELRTVVMKSLAEQPITLLVDLNGTRSDDPLPLLILPTLERRAVADYGLHLRCYLREHHPERERWRGVLGRQMTLYANRAQALTAGLNDAANLKRMHVRLPADESSSATARDLVADACRQWSIPELAEDAQIIASELASNAVRHTGLDFDVVALFRPPFLHIHVFDADPRVPVFPIRVADSWARPRPGQVGGWGLYLVYAIATGCGVAVRPSGKIVWATLRTDPVTVWHHPPGALQAP
jgi:hypothetical protein